MNAMARLRALWATTQGKVAIIGSGAGVAGLLGLRARNKKAAAGGGIAPAVAATPPAGDTSYAGGQASGPLGPAGFGSNFLPTPGTVGTGTGLDRLYTPVSDWQGPNLYEPPVTGTAQPGGPPTITAPPAASAPVQPVAIINRPPPAYTARPAPVTGSPIASVTQRFTSPYDVATNQQLADYSARNAPGPSAPAPVAPNPVRVIPPPTAAPVYRSLTTPTSNVTRAPAKTPAPVAARPGPGPPLKGPR